jgi:hypothetical protein
VRELEKYRRESVNRRWAAKVPSLLSRDTAFLALLLVLLATDASAWVQAAVALGQPPPPKSLWDSLWDVLKMTVAQSGVEALFYLAFTIVTGWLVAKKKQLEYRIAGPDDHLVDRVDTFRQRVMVLGLESRSGKGSTRRSGCDLMGYAYPDSLVGSDRAEP